MQVTGLVVDSRDRPIVSGSFTTEAGGCPPEIAFGRTTVHEAFVARLTASGELDRSFNGTGVVAAADQRAAYEPVVDRGGRVVYQALIGDSCDPDLTVTRLSAFGGATRALGPLTAGRFAETENRVAVDGLDRVLLMHDSPRTSSPG